MDETVKPHHTIRYSGEAGRDQLRLQEKIHASLKPMGYSSSTREV